MHIIVACYHPLPLPACCALFLHFLALQSLHPSKRLITLACIPFHLLMDVLVPSLHRKSTDIDDALCQDLMHDCSSVGYLLLINFNLFRSCKTFCLLLYWELEHCERADRQCGLHWH